MNRGITISIHTRPRLTRRRLLVLCCALSAAFVARPSAASDRPQVLATDPVLLEWGNSHRGALTRHTRLKVYSSGLIESWPAGRGLCQREQRTPEEARAIADEIASMIHDGGLATEAIENELRQESLRTGLSFAIQDADDSIVQVATDAGRIEVRCATPQLLAERFPDAGRLQAFVRMERRVSNLSCIVQCGGRDAAERLCAKANEQLRAQHPGVAPWTISELMMVRTSSESGRFAQFCRAESHSNIWTTCVTESPGHPARVTVIPPASLMR